MKMKEQFKSKLQIEQTIPYYGNRFNSLIKVLNERESRLEDQHLKILPDAEYEVIVSGIMYYYNVIMFEESLNDEQKKKLCKKLVESTNRAIYVLLNEIDNANASVVQEYLNAYREYLQKIENDFRKEKNEQNIDTPSLIFTFSLELLGDKMHIDSLFTTIYESSVISPRVKLCSVFAPSDIEIKNIFCYLPMLTHEISHNFKYSITEDRNQFVVNYMLKEVSKMIILQMFFVVSDYCYTPVIGKAERVLVNALMEVLREELLIFEPDYLKEGHLDYLPSLIYSLICATFPSEKSLEVFYNDKFEYDILQNSYINLAKLSDLNWYVADKANVDNRKKDEEIIASLLLDLLSCKSKEEVKNTYENISLKSIDNNLILKNILDRCNDDIDTIDMKVIDIALEEIILSIIDKLSYDFYELKNKFDKNCNLVDDVLLSLFDTSIEFENNMNNLINAINDDGQHNLYDFCDRCLEVRHYLDNIFNISMLNIRYITKNKKGNRIILKLYKHLRKVVEISLEDKNLKPYFVTRKMNAALVKLGLYNDENGMEIFSDKYISALKKIGDKTIYKTIEDYLAVYREIFADLSMCAAFNFNQLGYLRYMTEQFRNVREMGGFYAKDMALERIHIVLKVLEKRCGKQWLVESYKEGVDLELQWTDEWNMIIKSYLDQDNESEYDERYKLVYYEKILPSEWILHLQEDEIVQVIGRYYNEKNVSFDEKEKICKKFLSKYTDLFRIKEEIRKNSNEESVNILLGEMIYDES